MENAITTKSNKQLVLNRLKSNYILNSRKLNEHLYNKHNPTVDILATTELLQTKITLQTEYQIKKYRRG